MKYTCIYISPTIRGLGSLGSTGNIHSQSSVKRRLKDGTFEFFPTDRDLGQETRVDCTFALYSHHKDALTVTMPHASCMVSW
jgi:hypothetical protein